MTAAFVYAAMRTPFGRYGGAPSGVRPDDLAAIVLNGVLDKAPALDRGEAPGSRANVRTCRWSQWVGATLP
jgi:acetyl-CoA acetyltransferase